MDSLVIFAVPPCIQKPHGIFLLLPSLSDFNAQLKCKQHKILFDLHIVVYFYILFTFLLLLLSLLKPNDHFLNIENILYQINSLTLTLGGGGCPSVQPRNE